MVTEYVNDPPRVSVVIPTYNRADVLPRALASVLTQTYGNFEVVVVDDHSKDATQNVIAQFTHDTRVKTVRHESNMGQSRALNTGIAVAQGEYVAFLDDDDVWLPNKLALQVAVLEVAPPEVGLVYCWRQDVDERSGQPLRSVRQTLQGDIFDCILALNTPVPPSSWLVRTSAARATGGFDESLQRAKDVDFVCRLCELGWQVAYTPSVVLLKYHHGRGQMVDETPENLAQRAAFIRRHLKRFETELAERPSAHAQVYIRLARYELRYQRLRGLVSVAHAFHLDPARPTAKIEFYARRLYGLLRTATRLPQSKPVSLSDKTQVRLY